MFFYYPFFYCKKRKSLEILLQQYWMVFIKTLDVRLNDKNKHLSDVFKPVVWSSQTLVKATNSTRTTLKGETINQCNFWIDFKAFKDRLDCRINLLIGWRKLVNFVVSVQTSDNMKTSKWYKFLIKLKSLNLETLSGINIIIASISKGQILIIFTIVITN